MARKKFVRDDKWQRQPHVKDGPPPSLWWYRRPDKRLVIDAYISKYRQGRSVPDGFKEDIVKWLEDLSALQNKKPWGQPRTLRYWAVPSYALAHKMEPATLMKRLREMENIAKQLFPDSVPSSRKTRAALTEAEKKEIRQLYLDGMDAKALAQRFHIAASKVGHLCREQKATRDAARKKAQNEAGPAPSNTPDSEMPF
jgi:hypothetical protein